MHARTTTLEAPAERMDEAVSYLREQIIPQLQQQDGYKGLIALGDRQSGKLHGVVLWESKEAMRASEEAGERLRGESAQGTGSQIAGVERYEVAIFEVSS